VFQEYELWNRNAFFYYYLMFMVILVQWITKCTHWHITKSKQEYKRYIKNIICVITFNLETW